jgi:thiol-disulfide isomerase/thioredoxin
MFGSEFVHTALPLTHIGIVSYTFVLKCFIPLTFFLFNNIDLPGLVVCSHGVGFDTQCASCLRRFAGKAETTTVSTMPSVELAPPSVDTPYASLYEASQTSASPSTSSSAALMSLSPRRRRRRRRWPLEGKHVALYFGAAWCAPCRKFSKTLQTVYTDLAKLYPPLDDDDEDDVDGRDGVCINDASAGVDNDIDGDGGVGNKDGGVVGAVDGIGGGGVGGINPGRNAVLEVVFCSSDDSQQAYDAYTANMPWLAFPFADKRSYELKKRFMVLTLPKCIIVAPDGSVTCMTGVAALRDSGAAGFPWADYSLVYATLKKAKKTVEDNCTLQ